MFINPDLINQNDLPKIIAHEKVHIREYHWFDLIIIELLTVIFWFNPFIWLYEHSMRQNHEYLADKGVLSMGYSEDQYRALLLNQTFGTVTNINGEFERKFPLLNDLVLSYVGKETIVDDLSDIKSKPIQEKYQRRYIMREGVFNLDREVHFSSPPPPPPSPVRESTDQTPYVEIDEEGYTVVFFVVEDMPAYPGGLYVLGQYVKGMEEKLSREQNLKGEVLVGFTIDKNGKVSDIRILETDNITIASGAIDIVSGMADWSPGKQRGTPVPVNFTLPLEF